MRISSTPPTEWPFPNALKRLPNWLIKWLARELFDNLCEMQCGWTPNKWIAIQSFPAEMRKFPMVVPTMSCLTCTNSNTTQLNYNYSGINFICNGNWYELRDICHFKDCRFYYTRTHVVYILWASLKCIAFLDGMY